jgi:hypothetical protein
MVKGKVPNIEETKVYVAVVKAFLKKFQAEEARLAQAKPQKIGGSPVIAKQQQRIEAEKQAPKKLPPQKIPKGSQGQKHEAGHHVKR